MNIEISERPLTEIRLKQEDREKYINWIELNKFCERFGLDEYFMLMPHPKHKFLGGMDLDEFLEGCPGELNVVIRGIYENRMKERNEGSSSKITGFDLDNDFGYLLIAFI